MRPIRCAVVGTGHLGKVHATILRRIEQGSGRFELAAVVDCDESRCNAFANPLRIKAATKLEDILPEIDAAIIATPTVTHHQVASLALNHGKHCFVEKPFALDMTECRELIDLAEGKQCTLQVGHVENFNPVWTGVRDRLSNVRFVDAVRSGTYTGRSTDIGIVMDLMIHDLDLIAELIDSPVELVSAFGFSVLSKHEDFAEAHLHFRNGSIARVRSSRLDEQLQRTMAVYADGLTAHLNFADGTARLCECGHNGDFNNADSLPYDERLKVKESLFTDWMPTETVSFNAVNAIEQELLEFATSIEQRVAPQVDGQRGLRAVTMAEQVLAAIEHSRWQQSQTSSEQPFVVPFPSKITKPRRFAA